MNLQINNFGQYRLTDSGRGSDRRYVLFERDTDTVVYLTRTEYLIAKTGEDGCREAISRALSRVKIPNLNRIDVA